MAAGAIPPPRFFEHCRPVAQIACLATAVQGRPEQPAASITCESTIAKSAAAGALIRDRKASPPLKEF
jgi:hypothetical protein